jgi:PAS domain S-box-containing protein
MERCIMNALTLLLIEDNPGDARLLQEMLRDLGSGYHMVWVQTLAEALEKIASKRFHLILCDLDLMDAHGLETASAVIVAASDTPIIIVSGQDDDQTALEAIKDGVQDYLVKDTVTPEIIGRSIRYAIERKRAEVALRESETQFRTIFEVASVGILQSDSMTGRILKCNDTYCRITGYSQSELLGVSFLDLTHPEDRQRDWDIFSRAARGETPVYYNEKRYIRKDGSFVWVRLNAAFVRNSNGKAVRTVAICEDISERKRTEVSLRESEKALRAMLSEKEVLLKEVHHRVKNNLQVISSLISLQADSMVDKQLTEVLGDVRDRVRTMALVHEKLYQTEDLARLDFAEYGSSLLNYLWRAHGAATGNVRLNMLMVPLILPVEMAVHCGLILNELGSNAIKHAFPNGCGEVTVTLAHDPATGAACLRVRDNGVGLPADLDWRQSSSLGLRLVQMLAGQMCGSVQTGPGPGTEFQINFNVKGITS